MINPIDIAFYDADEAKLQEFLLFCLFVANKNASRTALVLEKFLGSGTAKPFDKLCSMIYNYKACTLKQHLVNCRTGQYTRLEKALNKIHYNYEAGIDHLNDLKNISLDELLNIPGIGRKTANYFLMYTRRGYRGAALDTHLLHYLRDLGYSAPKNTPQSKAMYAHLESCFLDLCDFCKITPQKADLEIWKYYAGRDCDSSKIPHFDKLTVII